MVKCVQGGVFSIAFIRLFLQVVFFFSLAICSVFLLLCPKCSLLSVRFIHSWCNVTFLFIYTHCTVALVYSTTSPMAGSYCMSFMYMEADIERICHLLHVLLELHKLTSNS